MVNIQLQGRPEKVAFIWTAIWPTLIALLLRNKGREDIGGPLGSLNYRKNGKHRKEEDIMKKGEEEKTKGGI